MSADRYNIALESCGAQKKVRQLRGLEIPLNKTIRLGIVRIVAEGVKRRP